MWLLPYRLRMENYRIFLIIGIAFVSYLLWQQWDIKQNTKNIQQVNKNNNSLNIPSLPKSNINNTKDLPNLPKGQSPEISNTVKEQKHNIVTVNTDVITVKIDTLGGTIVDTQLNKHFNSIDVPKEKIHILGNKNNENFYIQSGFVDSK